jgi:sugar/nucleoside kinase (ribokinase family)/DNA-directed RNA polymerase specialized sigma24 family protein
MDGRRPMLTTVGSIAFDSVETPFGAVEHELGGSAVYSAIAASHFTQVRTVGPVGEDFGENHLRLLEARGLDTGGVQAIPGRQTFSWRGRYDFSLSAQTVETGLNAFDGWRPRLSTETRASDVLFLAAMDPEVQLDVRGQAADAGCVALDSMSYWITTKRDALIEAIRGVDIVLMNDHEARELTEQPMLLTAAREIASWGPRAVVVRLGEYGCALLGPGGYFSIPGYPLEQATDPTGSGDAFAGGFLGYLDLVRGDWGSAEVLRRAVTYGCVMSSFCYEDFGVRRLLELTRQEIDYRFTDFRALTHFEQVPMHPRPRNGLAQESPAVLERPGPTATTGPRKPIEPTAATPSYAPLKPTAGAQRSRHVVRPWHEPHAFRRAAGPFLPAARSTGFSTPPSPARLPDSAPWGLDRAKGLGGAGSGRQEPVLYAVVAREAPRKVGEALRRRFEDDPTVTVVEESREADRRAGGDRRETPDLRGARLVERRNVVHADGLRVAERRTALGPSLRDFPLPRAARNREHQVVFGSHLPCSLAALEDVQAARLALVHQAGDTRSFEELYRLWFDRAYTFFTAVHSSPAAAEDAVNVAYARVFERLGEFAPSAGSFRRWFGAIVADLAFEAAHDDEAELAETRLLDRWIGDPDLEALTWMRDEDLIMLVRQLPSPQRETVALKYIFGLDDDVLAEIAQTTPSEIAELHDRALRFMSGCLTSLSRRPGFSGRLPMMERRRYYPVTTGRKRALVA